MTSFDLVNRNCMKTAFTIFFALFLFAVFTAEAQHNINPIARKLNDSAVNIGMAGDDDQLRKAIDLFNQAIKIDSNNILPYWNKMNFQNQLKQYNEAIVTGCQMIKMRPKDVVIKMTVGEIYDRSEDSINSKKLYNTALSILNVQLDTMSKRNAEYRLCLEKKAFMLILLNQAENGHEILNELYNSEIDERKKTALKMFLDWNKHDIIYGKETTSDSY